GSAPNVCDHIAWLITTTGWPPGARLSVGSSIRPRKAETPSAGKYSPDTSCTLAGCGSLLPSTRRYIRATRLMAATISGLGAAGRNSVKASYEKRAGTADAAVLEIWDVR